MELNKVIAQLEQDVIRYKTGQPTQGDSANYYCVAYEPGWFIIAEGRSATREHTIKCIPKIKNEKAIFMPQFCPDSIAVQAVSIVGRALYYDQNIITWGQPGEYQSNLNNPGYAIGCPKSLMIFSNVDFYIETSYIDTYI